MSNAVRKLSESDYLFHPACLLISCPWNWCARPKPERSSPVAAAPNNCALILMPHSQQEGHFPIKVCTHDDGHAILKGGRCISAASAAKTPWMSPRLPAN